MKLQEFENSQTLALLENSSELKVISKYKSYNEVKDNIGLAIHKSSFFGTWRDDDELIPADPNTLVFNHNGNLRIYVEGVFVLGSVPSNTGGTISYHGYGRIEVGDSLLYDGRGGGKNINNSEITEAPEDSKVYGRKDKQWEEIDFNSADSLITEDVEAIGTGSALGIDEGDIIAQGSTITEAFKQLLQKTIPPVYNSPTSSLSISSSSTLEVGSTTDYALSPSFNKNDAGDLNQVVIKRDGVTISTQALTSVYNDLSRIVQPGNVNYSAEYTYLEGEVKNDNFGNPDSSGQIPAGSILSSLNAVGAYYNWSGPYLSTPTQSADIRSLTSSFSNSFTLNTGNSSTVMVLGIPATKTLVSIIDADALNADITSNYILSGTLNQVEDGGGNLISYKIYVLTIATAYSSNHRHNITLS